MQDSPTIRQQDVRVDPVAVFTMRCNARARLYATGEIDLHVAVDELQESAELNGLAAAIGQDAVQAIMAAAFSAVPPAADLLPDDQYDGSTFAALCDQADEKQSRKPVDARTERARALIADDDISLDRAWRELNKRAPGDVADATLEAAEYLAFQQNDLQRLKGWLAPRSHDDVAAIRKHLSKRGSSCR